MSEGGQTGAAADNAPASVFASPAPPRTIQAARRFPPLPMYQDTVSSAAHSACCASHVLPRTISAEYGGGGYAGNPTKTLNDLGILHGGMFSTLTLVR